MDRLVDGDKEQALAYVKRVLKRDFEEEYELVKKPPPETFSLACLSLVDQADLSQKRYQVSNYMRMLNLIQTTF